MDICVAQIPGCERCQEEAEAKLKEDIEFFFEKGHTCRTLCHIKAKIRRLSNAHHELAHAPIIHDCGAILNDRKGNRFEYHKHCPFKTCTISFCPGCRRATGGLGDILCPCDKRVGHGTYAEHRRPGAGRLIKKSIRKRISSGS